MATEEPRLEDYLGVLWKRKWIVITSVVLITATTMILTFLQTPVYQTSTMLNLKQRQATRSDIDIFGGAGLFSTQTEINTQIEILKSRTLMEEVVRTLGPERIRKIEFIKTPSQELRSTLSKAFSSLTTFFSSLPAKILGESSETTPHSDESPHNPGDNSYSFPQDPQLVLHQLAGYIGGRIAMEPVRDTRVIKITASSYSPQLARDLANALAQAATQRNIISRRRESSAALDFISQQAELIGTQLIGAEDELQEYKEIEGFMRLSIEADLKVENLARHESDYQGVRISREELQVRLKEIRKQLGIIDRTWESSLTISNNPVVQVLKQQLTQLQVGRAQLLREFSEGAPEVAQVDSKIQEIEAQIRNEVETIVSGKTESVSPAYTNLYTKLVDYETQVNTLVAKEVALKQLVDEYQEEVNKLPEQEIRLARLERKRRVNEELYTTLLKHRNEARIQAASEIGNIEVVDPAILPRKPSKPRKEMNGALALISGLLCGVMLAFLGEYMDRTIKDEKQLKELTNLTILGNIPLLGSKAARYGYYYGYGYGYGRRKHSQKKGQERKEPESLELICYTHPKSSISEHYRVITTNLGFVDLEKELKTLLITSSIPKEGKTFVATSLAITFARAGEKTLLVDADLRNHHIHRIFGFQESPGLTDLIKKECSLEDALRPASNIDNLTVLTTGSLPPNPTEFLGSPQMAELITQLRERYDKIIFDTPPTLLMADAPVLSTRTDGTLFLVGAGEIEGEILLRSKESLDRVQAKIVGVILNKIVFEAGHYGRYKYYYHYYYSHYADEEGKKKRKVRHHAKA